MGFVSSPCSASGNEEGIGLYDCRARFYDPQLARFAQADTIVPNPTSSQAFNRYSYVTGNPLRYTDPTGHYEFEESPDDEYFISAATGIMPARRSRSPHAYTSTERRKLILRRGRHLREMKSITSLEKFARLTEYSATLFRKDDADNYMLDLTYVINGWSRENGMFVITPNRKANNWLGLDTYPQWGGWADKYNDSKFVHGGTNNQMYHFWFYVATSYFDGKLIAHIGNRVHEATIPDWVPIIGGSNQQGVSKQDFDLSLVAVDLGQRLQPPGSLSIGSFELPVAWNNWRNLQPRQIGNWIRFNLGGQ